MAGNLHLKSSLWLVCVKGIRLHHAIIYLVHRMLFGRGGKGVNWFEGHRIFLWDWGKQRERMAGMEYGRADSG